MVNRPSLHAMQIVGNGSSRISATLKTYWKYLSVHITPRLVFIYVDKKKMTKQSIQASLYRKLFFRSDSGRMESALLLTPTFSIHASRGPRKRGGGLATKPMWHVQEKWEARRINFPAVVASSGHMVYTSVLQLCLFPSGWREPRSHQTL